VCRHRARQRLSRGGAEVQLYIISRLLAAQEDFCVTLHVADIGQPERVENGLRIKPLVRLKAGLQISARAIPAIVGRLARERHRVYVTRSASSISGLTQIAAALSRGRHMHMCAHDNECAGQADAMLSRPAKWLQNMGMRRADMVTCQTIRQIELLRNAFGSRAFSRRIFRRTFSRLPRTSPAQAFSGSEGTWTGKGLNSSSNSRGGCPITRSP